MPLLRIFIRLVGFHPHDLDLSRKRSQSPTFKVPAPSLRLSSPRTQSVKAANHAFAITDEPPQLALLKRSVANNSAR
eukprot:4698170-Amphidinium_carterae.1